MHHTASQNQGGSKCQIREMRCSQYFFYRGFASYASSYVLPRGTVEIPPTKQELNIDKSDEKRDPADAPSEVTLRNLISYISSQTSSHRIASRRIFLSLLHLDD